MSWTSQNLIVHDGIGVILPLPFHQRKYSTRTRYPSCTICCTHNLGWKIKSRQWKRWCVCLRILLRIPLQMLAARKFNLHAAAKQVMYEVIFTRREGNMYASSLPVLQPSCNAITIGLQYLASKRWGLMLCIQSNGPGSWAKRPVCTHAGAGGQSVSGGYGRQRRQADISWCLGTGHIR